MLLQASAAACLLPSLAFGVNITFFETKVCTEHRLFGDKIDVGLSCHDVSGYAPSNSTALEDFAPGQAVYFYSDPDCKNEIYMASDDSCFVHGKAAVVAVKVVSEYAKSITTDVAVYNMSDYSGETAVFAVSALPLSNFFLGYGFGFGAGTVTIASIAIGCYSALSGDPLSITGCILGPLSTILVATAAYFKGQAGATARESFNVRMGQITDAKRDVIDPSPDMSGLGGVHIGYMEHDVGAGNQTSPVFELVGGDGESYHIASFFNQDSGAHIHRMYAARHAELQERDGPEKRDGPGYLNVRWNEGGLDFAICNFNEAADTSTLQQSNDDLYDIFYQDLSCLFSRETIEQQKSIFFDVYNGGSNVIGGVEIVPFSGSGGGIQGSPQCDVDTAQNQACVN